MSSSTYEIYLVSPQRISDFSDLLATTMTDFEEGVKNIIRSAAKDPCDMLGLSPNQGDAAHPVYIYYSSSDNTDKQQDRITVKGIGSKIDIASKQRNFPSPPIPSLPGMPSIYEGQITIPSLQQLELSSDYLRNTIMLWLELTVNPTPDSKPFKLPIKLPEPYVGNNLSITSSTSSPGSFAVSIGKTAATPQNTDAGFLGSPDVGGEIRWYSMEVWNNLSLEKLTLPSFSGIDETLANINSNAIQLTPLITDETSKIRLIGELISPTEWSDDGISFTVPNDPNEQSTADSGFAIIWRDDLPSKPIPVLSNFLQILCITSEKLPAIPDFTDPATFNLTSITHGLQEAAKQVTARMGAMSEGTIFIYYCSFTGESDTQTDQVKAELSLLPDLRIASKKMVYASTSRLLPSIFEIKAWLPSMRQLETSPNYKRNSILMWLNLKIVNRNNKSRKSGYFGFPLWLPAPSAGKPLVTMTAAGDTQIQIGTIRGGLHRLDDSDDFGAPSRPTTTPIIIVQPPNNGDGGQVRWYPLDSWNNIQLNMLQPFSLTGIDETINCKDTKSITLSQAVTRATSEIRRAGTFLPCDQWHDDGIVFTIPKAVDKPIGFIIIWRDDIPSNPVPILDSIDWNQLLERFAKRLFHWNINGININWDDKPNNEAINENNPIPLPLTEDTLSFCLDRMVMEANAFLERYLAQFGLDIQFTFQLTPAADSCFSGKDLKNPYVVPIDTQSLSAKPTTGLSFTNLSSINPTCRLTLANLNFNLPWATLYELAANPKNRDFYLESAIKISFRLPIDNPLGIKLPNELLFHLPTVKFTRVLLEIPTMALLFEHADFQGVPMVFMPGNSAIPAFNYDDTNSGQIADIKHKIWQALDVTRALLGVTQVFKKSQELEVAGKILEWIDNATHIVINTQGQIDDLRQCVIEQKGILGNNTFNGIISSIILIGIPGNINNFSLRCNTDTNHHGEILKIAVPDGTFIAAIPNVGYLQNSYTSPFFTTPIPKPTVLNSLGPDSSGLYHYNDKIQSLKFEPLYGITRWFNPATRDEFYTQSCYGELSYRNGYQYEGTVFQLFPDYYGDELGKPFVTTPFYRYINAKTGIHYYTTDQNVPNFTLEGVLGWIATSQLPGTAELHYWHNPQTGGNFYSTNYGEGTVAQTLGYQYQGIKGWAIPV